MTNYNDQPISDLALRVAIRDLEFAGKPSEAVVLALRNLQTIGHLAMLASDPDESAERRFAHLARIRALAGN